MGCVKLVYVTSGKSEPGPGEGGGSVLAARESPPPDKPSALDPKVNVLYIEPSLL